MGLNHKQLTEKEGILVNYAGPDKVIPVGEIKAEQDKDTGVIRSFSTKIYSLDRLLNNVEGGEMVVITGPTGAGKTQLLMQITRGLSLNGVSQAWFSLEVTMRQFIIKFLKGAPELPHFYTPASVPDTSFQWLLDRMIEAVVKHDVKVIHIDHIHQIFNITRMNISPSLEIGELVSTLKQFSIAYNVVIFLIAHCTDNKVSPTAEPRMQDIRDSGMISRLADSVVGIWRVPNKFDGTENRTEPIGEQDTRSKVRVYKNRREGTVGYFVMDYQNYQLVEITPEKKYEHSPLVATRKRGFSSKGFGPYDE